MQILKQRHSIKLDDKKRQEKYLKEQMDIQTVERSTVDKEVDDLVARVLDQDKIQKDMDLQIQLKRKTLLQIERLKEERAAKLAAPQTQP